MLWKALISINALSLFPVGFYLNAFNPGLDSSYIFSALFMVLALWERSLHIFLLDRKEKETLSAWIVSSLWSWRRKNIWTSQSCFLSSNWICFFLNASIRFAWLTAGYNCAAAPNAQLLGLGSKLYPSNMQRMLNKDFTLLMQSLSWVL